MFAHLKRFFCGIDFSALGLTVRWRAVEKHHSCLAFSSTWCFADICQAFCFVKMSECQGHCLPVTVPAYVLDSISCLVVGQGDLWQVCRPERIEAPQIPVLWSLVLRIRRWCKGSARHSSLQSSPMCQEVANAHAVQDSGVCKSLGAGSVNALPCSLNTPASVFSISQCLFWGYVFADFYTFSGFVFCECSGWNWAMRCYVEKCHARQYFSISLVFGATGLHW